MLSFITVRILPSAGRPYLNTSHVIFYPIGALQPIIWSLNLNTSHVIFYRHNGVCGKVRFLFKYISCYLLSDNKDALQVGNPI